jgi:FKBP-type peptidyl-prolyl cis-trans isomerase (trigger factor)
VGRVSGETYTDRRCDDLQRECDRLQATIETRCRLLDEEIDRRIRATEDRHDHDVIAVKDQTEQSRVALEHRLDGMNEFREQLRDQATRLVTRELLDGIVNGLRTQDEQQEKRLLQLERQVVADEGAGSAENRLKTQRQTSITTMVAIVTTILFLVSAVVSVVLLTRPG